MGKTLLEKMFAKPTYKVAIIHAPEELKSELWINNNIEDNLTDSYNFILSFTIKLHELEQELSQLKNSLAANGLLWIAYPIRKILRSSSIHFFNSLNFPSCKLEELFIRRKFNYPLNTVFISKHTHI